MENKYSTEERLERLESALTMQDQTVEDLNKFIIAQQKQIADLERKMKIMAETMKDLKEAVAHAAPSDDTPPPHYGQL